MSRRGLFTGNNNTDGVEKTLHLLRCIPKVLLKGTQIFNQYDVPRVHRNN